MKALSASCYYYYYRAYCRYVEGNFSWKVVISHTHTEITWCMFVPGVLWMRLVEIYESWNCSLMVLSATQFIQNQGYTRICFCKKSICKITETESVFNVIHLHPRAFLIQRFTIKNPQTPTLFSIYCIRGNVWKLLSPTEKHYNIDFQRAWVIYKSGA